MAPTWLHEFRRFSVSIMNPVFSGISWTNQEEHLDTKPELVYYLNHSARTEDSDTPLVTMHDGCMERI